MKGKRFSAPAAPSLTALIESMSGAVVQDEPQVSRAERYGRGKA